MNLSDPTPNEVQAAIIADLEAKLSLASEREFYIKAENARLRAEAALAAAVDRVINGGDCREKILYIHVPCEPRGYMVGQPVKVILPAAEAAMKGTK
jgi:hypothetical protein